MDPRRLILFAGVVEQGSLSRAADVLHLSQPSLSRQIATLEREAGCRLLERLSAGVTPTAAGHELMHRAQAVRAHTAAAARELDEHQRYTLRIAAFPTAIQTFVVAAVGEMRRECPRLEVTIEEADHLSALERALTGHVDITVTFADFRSNGPSLATATQLLREPMFLATAEADREISGSPVPLAQLREHDWILGTDDAGMGLIRRACLAAGFEPRVSARLDHQSAIQAAVAAGVGVTLLPALATRHLQPGVALHALARPLLHRFVLAHTMTGWLPPATDAGLRALQQTAQEAMRAAWSDDSPLSTAKH